MISPGNRRAIHQARGQSKITPDNAIDHDNEDFTVTPFPRLQWVSLNADGFRSSLRANVLYM